MSTTTFAEEARVAYEMLAADEPVMVVSQAEAWAMLRHGLDEWWDQVKADEPDGWPLIAMAGVCRRVAEDLGSAADFAGQVADHLANRRSCECDTCAAFMVETTTPYLGYRALVNALEGVATLPVGERLWLVNLVDLAARCEAHAVSLAESRRMP